MRRVLKGCSFFQKSFTLSFGRFGSDCAKKISAASLF